MSYSKTVLFSICFLFNAFQLCAQVEIQLGETILTEREVAVDLSVPWEILWGHDDYIWATERRGRVLRINPTTGNVMEILDIQNLVHADFETGLLGMAFHPDFESTQIVYLAYSYRESFNTNIKLVSYEWNGTELFDENLILDIVHQSSADFHNGARILISDDKKIFLTIGEGGRPNNAQNLSNFYGKILRLNLDGSIPDDNPSPFTHIYSYGHRNPQGLAFGPDNTIYSTEHGDLDSDELNIIVPNKNYGWPRVEGACDSPQEETFCSENEVIEPIYDWSPCVAVNDLLYYDHEAIPEWSGKLLVAILGGFAEEDPRISVLSLSEDGKEVSDEKVFFEDYGRIRDLCINPHNGAIFFATNGPYYPGFGPNRIIEYRNLSYGVSPTENIINSNQYFEIYPNVISTNDQISIKCSDNFVGNTFEIYNYDGRLIDEIDIHQKEFTLSTTGLNAGNYFVSAVNKNGRISKSFIVN